MTMDDKDNTYFLLTRFPGRYQPWWGFPSASSAGRKKIKAFKNRLNLILPEIKLNENKTLIDIGCNVGWNTFELGSKGISVTGVDKSKSDIELNNFLREYHNLDKNHIEFIAADANRFFRGHEKIKINKDVFNVKKKNTTYDYCICLNVMHHFLDQWKKNKAHYSKWMRDTGKKSLVFNERGIELLKNIQANCKTAFFQIRLRTPFKSYEEEDSNFVKYLINEIGFKSYKILQTENSDDYLSAPNPIYMFNN